MTQAVVASWTIAGVEAVPVEVQVDVSSGLPGCTIVGLADTAVLEARDRVRASLRAAGYDFPNARVVVNLAPAPLPKHGTGFDLPIALGILAATAQIPRQVIQGVTAVGELSLDGAVRAVPGLLAHALASARADAPLLVADGAVPTVAAVPGLRTVAVLGLAQLRHGLPDDVPARRRPAVDPGAGQADLSEVRGQPAAKRALELAAAGGLNLLLVGPPGAGKTMLARRLPGILPALAEVERLETAVVHSVAGLDPTPTLSGMRPFRAPHHTASTAGLVGGGSPPMPGEASLAHNGVLFLDEVAQFSPSALQALRQPLEDGWLTLVRAGSRYRYPARFSFVAAMNPCPCGFLGDRERSCECAPGAVDRYRTRLGGPLTDRMDMTLRVDRMPPSRLLSNSGGEECSMAVRVRVEAARDFAERRGGQARSLSGDELLAACALDAAGRREVESVAKLHHLSGRGVTRLLRVARTIADLESRSRVSRGHIEEACCYRSLS